MTSIYSSTPLLRKLGIKQGFRVLLYKKPENYFELLYDLPAEIKLLKKAGNEEADFIHIFCKSFSELEKVTNKYLPALSKSGIIWISWPKVSSKIVTDLKEDTIRNYFLKIGLVDVKVAAIDDIWSGLKFVYRIKDR